MSAPAALTVKTPFEYDALPVRPTAPTSEALHGAVDQLLRGVAAADVAGDAEKTRRVAELLGRGGKPLVGARIRDHVEATFQISLREAQADAARGTGDDDRGRGVEGVLHVGTPKS